MRLRSFQMQVWSQSQWLTADMDQILGAESLLYNCLLNNSLIVIKSWPHSVHLGSFYTWKHEEKNYFNCNYYNSSHDTSPHGDVSSSLWLPDVVEIMMRKIKSSRQKWLKMQFIKITGGLFICSLLIVGVAALDVSFSISSFRWPKGAFCFLSTDTGALVFGGFCPLVNERAT